MDIGLARTFLAVLETSSFSEAAEKIHLTQSTVSMRIRALEEGLGRKLFERRHTGAVPTRAGLMFRRHAQAMLNSWAHAKLEVGLPPGLSEVCRIGAQNRLWDGLLIHALPPLRAALPQVAFHASRGDAEALLQGLRDGSLDLAVLYWSAGEPGLEAHFLFEDEFILVSSGPDLQAGVVGDHYVFLDWGEVFRREHTLLLPHTVPALHFGLCGLGLQCILEHPASGCFPQRPVRSGIRVRMH
ncbi:LysR family transcriptional regulator [Cribrihabitans neustonicus]|uniref:LysR family transcriptional regulator n=1 Tax=Cribrihabitans neustonicus TaxID=1429085 RepID=UPI003B59CD57